MGTSHKVTVKNHLSGWFFGLLGICALIFAVFHFGDLASFGAMLRRAQPLWLVAAAALQVVTYTSVSLGWKLVLDKAGSPLPLSRLVPVALSKLFADAMIPAAGMGGNIMLVDRLVKLGVPRGAAVAALLISMIGYYAAFAFFALVMLLLLWLHGKAPPPSRWGCHHIPAGSPRDPQPCAMAQTKGQPPAFALSRAFAGRTQLAPRGRRSTS